MAVTAADTLGRWGADPAEVAAMRHKEAAFAEMCRLIFTCSDAEWTRLKANVIGFQDNARKDEE